MTEKKFAATSSTAPLGVAYLLGRAHHALARRLRDALAGVGLTVAQYTALSFLVRESLSNAQLAERAMISPQAANEMVKAMTARGWITREPDPTHGRIIRIGLTDEGKAMLEQGDRCVIQIEALMLAGHSEEEALALRDELKRVKRGLSQPDL